MDRDQFWQMISPLNKGLYGFAVRMLGDKSIAEDALQDVLEKLWRMRKKLDPDKNPKSLAMTMMKNRCIDLIRKQGRYVDEQDLLRHMVVEQNIEHKDLIDQLQKRMELLPTQQKILVELKDFQGFGYEEISKIMDINVNTLRVNLSRARRKLTETLRDEWR